MTDKEEQGVQPSERELENVNEGIEQQETDEPSPPITAKQTEAQSLEEDEDYPASGPETKKQVPWDELMLPVGENSAKKTGMRLLPKVPHQIQRSSQRMKRTEPFQRAFS